MQDPIGGTCPYSFVAHKRNHAQLSFTSEVFPTVFYSETILWPTINGSPILQQYLLLSASFYRKYPLLIFSVILVLLLTGPSLSHCKCSFNQLCIGTAVANGFLCMLKAAERFSKVRTEKYPLHVANRALFATLVNVVPIIWWWPEARLQGVEKRLKGREVDIVRSRWSFKEVQT